MMKFRKVPAFSLRHSSFAVAGGRHTTERFSFFVQLNTRTAELPNVFHEFAACCYLPAAPWFLVVCNSFIAA